MDIRSDRQKGLSYVELGRKYHMDPRTAKRYAESPQKPEYTLSEAKPTKMDPYKQIVDEWQEEAPYSAQRILEKLREMGFDGGYSIVKAYVSSRKMDLNEKATVRFETMPGKQGQMDWGFFEDHLVYEDGKWKKLYCFLMILGYSRMRYIEFVTDMSTNTLIRCHQNAFRYFGGYPEEMLYDNMKQVVIKRLLKQEDSTLNRQFEDFAGFYGFKPILCRPYRGQTKGKVERTVQFVRDNYLERAVAENLNIVEVLDYIFSEEAKSKRKRAYEKQIQMSGFPIKKTLDDFDFSFQPSIDKRQIDELATMRSSYKEIKNVFAPLSDAYSKIQAASLELKPIILYAGNAFESFLLQIANDNQISLLGKNGIMQKSDALSSVLPKKHRGMIGYIGQVRNAADHGTDPDEDGKTWTVSEDTALLYPILVTSIIKDIYFYQHGSIIV